MTNQEIFDTCLTHLRAQGQRALNDRGTCQYRADDGLKCAIGALIPDDKYNPNFERFGVYSTEQSIALAAGLAKDQLDLAGVIQNTMHDTIGDLTFFPDLEHGADYVARKFNLEYSA